MLMQPFNELTFKVTIESTSPLLVKESRYTDDDKKSWAEKADRKKMPDVIPISRATKAGIKQAVLDRVDSLQAVGKLPFFIPGSSIRGVCRAHLERTLRSLDPPDASRVCDPFEETTTLRTASCSSVLVERRKQGKSFRPYQVSCPVCRLFGNTLQSSRIHFSDAERVDTSMGTLVQREHVRINRRTGGVAGAPLKFYGLMGARFRFEMRLENFELSHVLLAGLLLGDLGRGNLPIGSGRSKGYGRVRLHRCDIVLTYFGDPEQRAPEGLCGVAEHPDPRWADWFHHRYGVKPQSVPVLSSAEWRQPLPWRRERDLSFSEFQEVWQKLKLGWTDVPQLEARRPVEAEA